MSFWDWLNGLRELRIGRSVDHDERRRLPRLRCYLKVSAQNDRFTEDAYVVEMNSQGLRFHSNYAFGVGETLHLAYPYGLMAQGEALAAVPVRVIWSLSRRNEHHLVGCQFLLPLERLRESWAGHILQQLGFPLEQDPRKLPARQTIRYPAQIEATAQDVNGTHRVTVLDLGAGGALVESDTTLPEEVVLELNDPPGLSSKLRLVCRCLNCRPSPIIGRKLCHLQWVYLTPAETRKLGILLFHLLREGSPD